MANSRVPRLEMLWEAHDPRGVLVERFGFADAASADSWVAATVHEHWGIRIPAAVADRSTHAVA